MKRRCEDPLISQTLGFDTYRMGNCIKTDNESKYKIEELTKGIVPDVFCSKIFSILKIRFCKNVAFFFGFCNSNLDISS